MMIVMLAAAMTLLMLIATAVAVHNEAQRIRSEARVVAVNRFGPVHRRR